jgi:hypothetical protein
MTSAEFPANGARVSRTAFTAAVARAAHLLVDTAPHIFADTLAAPSSVPGRRNCWHITSFTVRIPYWPVRAPGPPAGAGSPKTGYFDRIPV